MRRVVSVWLPTFAIDRIRRRSAENVETSKRRNVGAPSPRVLRSTTSKRHNSSDRAILLTRIDHGRQIVAACCEYSASRGVSVGMTLAHGRALLPNREPLIMAHEPRRDAQALAALARWMIRFAPIVAVDPPDGLLLDISGCERLYPSEGRLIESMIVELGKLGFVARAASAATFGCAWAATRFISSSLSERGQGGRSGAENTMKVHPPPDPIPQGRGNIAIIPSDHEREHLAPLPIAALNLEQSTIDALREVGIERIEHLYPIPRRELAARFGMELLLHFDRAMSDVREVADAVRPIEPLRVERSFDGPVKQIETVMLAARELIDRLATMLLHREEGVRRLDVFLERIDAEPIEFAIRLSRPNRNARHVWSLLKPRLESINLGFGIERIALRASATARIRHEQEVGGPRHEEAAAKDEVHQGALGELIDAVVARFGAERICQLHPVESHLPERAARRVAAISPSLSGRGPGGGSSAEDRWKVHPSPNPLPQGRGDRPSHLLSPPQPAEVTTHESSAPISLRYNGEEHRIISANGPERIAEEWWSAPCNEQSRDYFKVQDDRGRVLWMFRAGSTGRWYVHGEWA